MIEHQIKAATCRVACSTEFGTGWLIAEGLAITARHCVLPGIAENEPIALYFSDSGDLAISAKIVAQSEEWDVCLLSLETKLPNGPLPVSLDRPREGETWQTFGYPHGKLTFGHRLSGAVAQVLATPKIKIDLDLSVDPAVSLEDYRGLSGAVVVCQGVAVGMIRLKVDRTLAALSLNQLERFFAEHGASLSRGAAARPAPSLADRGDFPNTFAEAVQNRAGSYLFLEGAHGYGKSIFCRRFQADDKALINLGAYCLSDPDSALGADYRAQSQVFLDWLATAVSALITGKPPRKQKNSYAEQIQQAAEYLDAYSEYCAQSKRRGMLFIDGLNEISGDALLSELLGLLPAKLPPQITVVMTAPNFANIAGALAGRVKQRDVFRLPPIPHPACHRYCQQELKPERVSPRLVERICEKAQGHPLYLRYLIEYSNHEATDDDLSEFPVLTGPIEEYYQRIWEKLLPDGNAVHLLALMARLRWGVSPELFAKALNAVEVAQFVSVMSRIRHLLADENSTAIYHASFAGFIIEQTARIDELAYHRLAQFCLEETRERYCVLNRIFHLSRAGDHAVFAQCNQAWFDRAVELGVDPDTLIADVDEVIQRAAMEALPDEFFRLTLLGQRVRFRYDTLFAQSARLIAEALIVLGRPNEALQHVRRLKTLIVGPDDALQIGFLLHQYGYDDEAISLLDRLQQRIIESYHPPIELANFLELCAWHIRTILLMRLASDGNGMEQVYAVLRMAERACTEASTGESSRLADALQPLYAEAPTYFLTFRGEYADLARLKEYQKAKELPEWGFPPPGHFETLCITLLKFESDVDSYRLPKTRISLPRLFEDLAELAPFEEIATHFLIPVTDTLVRVGAPRLVIEIFADKGGTRHAQPIEVRAKNGVDVNHEGLRDSLWDWRVAAFLDCDFRGPFAGVILGTGWLELIEHLIGTLYCCDGRARRAKADCDEVARLACRQILKSQVIEPLRFTLEQRAAWSDSSGQSHKRWLIY